MTKTFPQLLNNKIWHTTSLERFNSIIKTGFILTNPPLEDSERHSSIDGPQYNPLVRQLSGISLFNFVNFDPVSYEKKYISSTWYSFVPCYHRWEKCVWIEINREKVAKSLILGNELKKIADRGKIDGNRMPEIEVACLVDIKIEWFLNVFIYDETSNKLLPHNYKI